MVAKEAIRLIHCGASKMRLQEILRMPFSVSNIALLLFVFPILGIYYMGNNALRGTLAPSVSNVAKAAAAKSVTDGIDIWPKLPEYFSRSFILFFFLEVGIYLVLLWTEKRKDPLYYVCWISLLFIPYFHVGVSNDFCMRVSVPGVFLVMLYCNEAVVTKMGCFKKLTAPTKLRICALALALCIGCCTPIVEIARGCVHVITERNIYLANDRFYSLSDLRKPTLNFESSDYRDTLFFRYFAK